MSWNYRIIRHDELPPPQWAAITGRPRRVWFGLHEVYYDDAGHPTSWSSETADFACDEDEGAEGLIKSLELALSDARQRAALHSLDGRLLLDDDAPAELLVPPEPAIGGGKREAKRSEPNSPDQSGGE